MDTETLDGIYQSHVGDVYRYLLSLCHEHHLAEDVMQETFLRAYLYLEDCPAEKIKPWLFRVARNALVDVMRKSKWSQPREREFFDSVADGPRPEEEFLRSEQLREIWRVVDSLPDRQRQAIVLVDFNGLSYEEAAAVMDITPGYFKLLLFRARQKARKMREGDERDG